MSETTLVTLVGIVLGAGGVLLTTALTLIVAQLVRQSKRIGQLDAKLRAYWLYTRQLIVFGQTHAPGVPQPEVPAELIEDTVTP